MTRRAFHFDASACSGCKACQVACKDRSGLGPGVLWRRVYEVTGGGWTRRGAAWQHDVVAYNLSVACNHCDRPICMEVCPTGAITQRDDGIVLLDAERCMGCRYCSWACPYDALQFDADAGRMSKCDFCVDELDRGRDPACVAACPLRVLEVGDRDELEERYGRAVVAPLPDHALTRPAFYVTPHAAAEAAGADVGLAVANREEVRP